MKKRIVFMGSPEFSTNSLLMLIKNYEVVGVVTQPDRPAGRGKKIKTSPVKNIAVAEKIPVLQPKRLKDNGVFEKISDWEPDIIVVVAFGQILRSNILDDKKNRPFIKAHNAQALVAGIILIIVVPIIAAFTFGCGAILWFIMLYWAYKGYKGEYVNIPVITDFVKNQGWA